MVLPFESGTLWLNVMNWALGALTAACIAAVIVAALRTPHAKRHAASALGAGDIVGLTMADGGKPLEPPPAASKPAAGDRSRSS